MTETYADVVVVGGGPAGCSAALMARSLGFSTVIIEPSAIGGRLRWVPEIINLAGATASGPATARRMQQQLGRANVEVLRDTATAVRPGSTGATIKLATGSRVRGEMVVWAAGLRPRSIQDMIATPTHADGVRPAQDVFLVGPNFKRISVIREPIVVVGADRPLATLLRTHPDVAPRLIVLCPARDEYKLAELPDSPSLKIVPCEAIELLEVKEGRSTLLVKGDEARVISGAALITNLGSLPNTDPLVGTAQLNAAGYPLSESYGVVRFAGDVAHESHQRIAVALGDGARVVLDHFYSRNGLYQG